ncbi:MAG: hypothetical protein Q7K42_00025, partial [Candidatus Diapherotrites archaeon]|nr:hypothetical protein [Candidatus Diapherotrites archaeon]
MTEKNISKKISNSEIQVKGTQIMQSNFNPENEKETQGIPVYLTILVLIFGILLGSVGITLINPPGETYNVTTNPNVITKTVLPDFVVKTVSLTSDGFKSLGGEKNTIFKTFESNGIEFKDKEVSTDSDEGKQLIKDYNVQYLPTVLVNENDLKVFAAVTSQFAGIVKSFEENFQKIGEYYVVPESNVDKLQHLRLYLEETNIDPKFCVREDFTAKVILFDDPYCVNCIQLSQDQERILSKFGDKINFDYYFYPTTTANLAPLYGIEKMEELTRYYMAAQDQNKFTPFRQCILNKYCDKDDSGTANSTEIGSCSYQNDKYGKPVDQNTLELCTTNTDLDKNALEE